MRRVLLVAWLLPLWLVLWRDISVANVLSGLVVALAVIAVFPARSSDRRRHVIRPVRLLVFLGYFGWKLLESNLVLAREVLTVRDGTRTGIIAVPVTTSSEIVATIVANAISLTPGTLTLEIRSDPRRYYVHVLHLYDVDRVRRGILRLQELAERAFAVDAPIVGAVATGGEVSG